MCINAPQHQQHLQTVLKLSCTSGKENQEERRTDPAMAPSMLWCLSFCFLACLVSASPVDEHPTNESQVAEQEDHHHHMLKMIDNFKQYMMNKNKCPLKWVRHGSSCYRFVDCPKTHREAEEECQSYGENSHLVSIHADTEEVFLMESIVPEGQNDNIWIGGSNINNCQDFHWSDNSPMNYYSWGAASPSNCDGTKACIQMSKDTRFKTWVAEPCDTAKNFICENHF
ncbi:snaclec GPIB-binding protein subunit beta-like [Anolis sagrei]|uniref:snaclec GPIB-binding protein subunit beta-like n=1 Tax=Anolis sagrei TaxID=38937 RepID=UPI003520B909